MAYKIKNKKKRTHTQKWKRCVKEVGEQSPDVNPYAVCNSSLGKKSFNKK